MRGRIDVTTVAEYQVVRVIALTRCRPVVAVVVAVTNQTVLARVAFPRSRIPNVLVISELAGEVNSFVGAIG